MTLRGDFTMSYEGHVHCLVTHCFPTRSRDVCVQGVGEEEAVVCLEEEDRQVPQYFESYFPKGNSNHIISA